MFSSNSGAVTTIGQMILWKCSKCSYTTGFTTWVATVGCTCGGTISQYDSYGQYNGPIADATCTRCGTKVKYNTAHTISRFIHCRGPVGDPKCGKTEIGTVK